MNRRRPLTRRKGLRRNKRRDPAAREFQVAVLKRHPLCPCGREATVAHHLHNHGMGWRDHSLSNGIGLCHPCHRYYHDHGRFPWEEE